MSCDKDKAEMFNKFFSNVYTQEDLTQLPPRLQVTVHELNDIMSLWRIALFKVFKLKDEPNVLYTQYCFNILPMCWIFGSFTC